MTRSSLGQSTEVLAALDAGGQDEEVGLLLESRQVERGPVRIVKPSASFATAAQVGCCATNAEAAGAPLTR